MIELQGDMEGPSAAVIGIAESATAACHAGTHRPASDRYRQSFTRDD
ncbi:hypothetical protein [Methylobacillus glycogenes]